MSEHGFYHPEIGYWQTNGDVSEYILANYPPGTISYPLKPGEGYEPDGKGGWTPPPVPEPQPPVLTDLTPRQLRLGLLNIGIKPSDVAAAIDQLPSPDKERAEIEWEYGNTFQRDHPLIGILANHFNLSQEAVDKAWLASMAL